jgi:antitoxin (DNA-binding transcriptional repressor) of toxin-antitoxin stability system
LRHGRPVARIVPCDEASEKRRSAREALIARLRAQPARVVPRDWTREELYERD